MTMKATSCIEQTDPAMENTHLMGSNLQHTTQTKSRHQASTEVRPSWPKTATWLGPVLETGPLLLLETDGSHWWHCSSLLLWEQL